MDLPLSPSVAGDAPTDRVLSRLFLDHPSSVGESYFEHQRRAFSFAGSLAYSAVACFIHGLVPALCVRTGSGTVTRLYEQMVLNRRRRG